MTVWSKFEGSDSAFKREMVDRYSAREYGQDRSAVFVDCEQQVAIGAEIDVGDVSAVSKREGVAGTLRQVEHGHSIAHWREKGISIWSEDDVALSVDRAQ